MRFSSSIKNISVFSNFTASLASLGSPVAWLRLDDHVVRFTIIPDQGAQVWATLAIDSIFNSYSIQSAAPDNTINLEVPIAPLHRALKSAYAAGSASLRLTKKDNVPLLVLTIVRSSVANVSASATSTATFPATHGDPGEPAFGGREVETIVTQNVPVRVLNAGMVEGIDEPQCGEPDVHILLPPLAQIKAISDRYCRIASGARPSAAGVSLSAPSPKLELSANMHGGLRLSVATDALSIASLWTELTNPDLDPSQVQGGAEGIRNHPSTRMRELGRGQDASEAGWATVRVDGKDWSRVLTVGRLGGRVVACFIHEKALILYVYLASPTHDEESVLTYYIKSYST
ncbi:MAG: hypothetical protein M1826_001299 [Phylliscum demangeonii]|nr:MAG: hypothetical protein M1826_001299 [Phylliscum demangeonii]